MIEVGDSCGCRHLVITPAGASLFQPSKNIPPYDLESSMRPRLTRVSSAVPLLVDQTMDVDSSQAATALLTEHLQYTPLVSSSLLAARTILIRSSLSLTTSLTRSTTSYIKALGVSRLGFCRHLPNALGLRRNPIKMTARRTFQKPSRRSRKDCKS